MAKWPTLIHLRPFVADCRRLGLDDDAVREIEQSIIDDPEGSPVMAGTGGLRKMRFAPSAWRTGKSGALRVGYAAFPDYGTVVLVVIFAKNQQANLARNERNAIKMLLDEIKHHLQTRGQIES